MLSLLFEKFQYNIYCTDENILGFIKYYLTPFCEEKNCYRPGKIIEISKNQEMTDSIWIKYTGDFSNENKYRIMRIIRNLIVLDIYNSGEYLFFHASAFTYKSKAFVILGEKGRGKTSFLVDALLCDNTCYLSNDVVVFNKSTWMCYGVPKAPSLSIEMLEKYIELQSKVENLAQNMTSLNELLNKKTNKIRIMPKDFAKLFKKNMIHSAKFYGFILPYYDKKQKEISISPSLNCRKIIENNLSDENGILGSESHKQISEISNDLLSNMAVYEVKINETIYSETMVELKNFIIENIFEEIEQKYKIFNKKIAKNNNKFFITGHSHFYKCDIFIKIFEEKNKFLNEVKCVSSNFEKYNCLDINENDYYIVYKFLNYIDIGELNHTVIKEMSQQLATFHDEQIFHDQPYDYLSTKIAKSIEQVKEKYTDTNDIFELFHIINSYKSIIDTEDDLQEKVTIHGDFGLRNIKMLNGEIYLIDFEQSRQSVFWEDFIKLFNRELYLLDDKKYFLENYLLYRKSKIKLPSNLFCMSYLFYSSLGILKYNMKFNDEQFLKMGLEMIDKVSIYFSNMTLINLLIAMCIGDAFGIACTHMSRQDIMQTYGGEVEKIVEKNTKAKKYLCGEVSDDSMQNIALLKSFLSDPSFRRESQAEFLINLNEKYMNPKTNSGLLKITNNKKRIAWSGNTNGGMVRGISLGIIAYVNRWNDLKLIEEVVNSISLTHNTSSTIGAAIFVAKIISQGLKTKNLKTSFEQAFHLLCYYLKENDNFELISIINEACKSGPEKFIEQIDESGAWGFITRESLPAIISIITNKNFNDCYDAIRFACNRGGDSDSIGAVIGAIYGLFYGIDSVTNEIEIVTKTCPEIIIEIIEISDNLLNRSDAKFG